MKWKKVIAYTFFVCGVAVISNSFTSFVKHSFDKKALKEKENKVLLKESPEMEVPWVTYSHEERPKEGEQFAFLIIPRLDIQLPVIEGTEKEHLSRGVGHYSGSVLPGEPDNAVLSAHRDTYFKGVGALQKGDKVAVRTNKGTFIYEVEKYWITTPEDRTVIVPHNKSVLTLTTCYPFRYVGLAPKRYIIQSVLKRKLEV